MGEGKTDQIIPQTSSQWNAEQGRKEKTMAGK